MLTRELKAGSWYYYHPEGSSFPLIVRYLMSYEVHHKAWRFLNLNVLVPPASVTWINLLEREVHTRIELVHPTLNRYLSLFHVDEQD